MYSFNKIGSFCLYDIYYIISKLAFYVHCQWIKGYTSICRQTLFSTQYLSIQAKSLQNLTHNSN